MSLELLRAIEFAALRGWPALEQREVGGWVLRHASGGSIRANSVAALTWHGGDIAHAIATCEDWYRDRRTACIFTVSDVSVPHGLDSALAARGYQRGDDHMTMAKTVPSKTGADALASVSSRPSHAWMATYVSGLSADRRDIALQLIANLPEQAQFISFPTQGDGPTGDVASTGLTIVDGPLASVQCMATLATHRRRGGARHVLGTIEALAQRHGASQLYLQTGGDNVAAQALYSAFGFSVVGRYHTRTKNLQGV